MKEKKDHDPLDIRLGRFMSTTIIAKKTIIILLVIIVVGLVVAAVLRKSCCFSGFSRFVADMVYDGSFKDYLYNVGEHNNGWTILATIVGEFLLSGLVLAIIIGSFRSLGERYENGQYIKYNWKMKLRHILSFLCCL